MSSQVSHEQEPKKPVRMGVGGKQGTGSGRRALAGKPEGNPDIGPWSWCSSIFCGVKAWGQGVLGSGAFSIYSWNSRQVGCTRDNRMSKTKLPELEALED